MIGRGVGLLAGSAAAAIAAAGGWYTLFGGAEPPPVSLDQAVQQVQVTPSPTPAGSAAPRATASVVAATLPTSTAAPPATAAPRSDGRPEGKWSIDGGASFVGYRVVEELARIGANTAVGRTSAVTGELTFDGRTVSGLRVTADVRQLKSDDSRRDMFLRRQSLEADRYPEAVFILAEPLPVSATPVEGASLSAVAKGDLTLHGVTKRVEWPVEGRLVGGRLVVVGSLKVPFSDFSIAAPRAPLVLSVEDVAVMELSLVFAPAGGG